MVVMGGTEAAENAKHKRGTDADPLAALSRVRWTSLIDKTVGAVVFCGMIIAMPYVGASASSLFVITLFAVLALAALSSSGTSRDDPRGTNAILRSFQHFPHDDFKEQECGP